MCSSGTPMAKAVLRPRCWSGKKKTLAPRVQAQASTAAALEEGHTTPPRAPQVGKRDARAGGVVGAESPGAIAGGAVGRKGAGEEGRGGERGVFGERRPAVD